MNNTTRLYIPRKRNEEALVRIQTEGAPSLQVLMKNLAMNRVNVGDDWVVHMEDDTNHVPNQMFITNTHTGQVIALEMEPCVLTHQPVIRILETDTIEPSDEDDNYHGLYAFYPIPFSNDEKLDVVNYSYVSFLKQHRAQRFYLIHQGAFIQWIAFIGDPEELCKAFEETMQVPLNQEELLKFRLDVCRRTIEAMSLHQVEFCKGITRTQLQSFVDANS